MVSPSRVASVNAGAGFPISTLGVRVASLPTRLPSSASAGSSTTTARPIMTQRMVCAPRRTVPAVASPAVLITKSVRAAPAPARSGLGLPGLVLAGPGLVGRPPAAVTAAHHRLHLRQQVVEQLALAFEVVGRPVPRPVEPHVGELSTTPAEEQRLLRARHPAAVLLAPALDVDDVDRAGPGV